MSGNIPFVDLRAQHEEVRGQIESAIEDIINRSSFIGGSYVAEFEQAFADYIGTSEAVAVANGTDALWLSLVAAGVGDGDAVITVPNTFIATVEAITRTGAHPLFVDIDLETSNIDVGALGKFLTSDCKHTNDGTLVHKETGKHVVAIMPVHLYGLPVDLQPILELAESFGLLVIEDACQAHGARYKMDGDWKRVGTFGLAAGFSFYPGKNLGAMGDGGAVVTNDLELARKMRVLRDHGSSEKYIHGTSDGWNSRLDALQAAVLAIKLTQLDSWNLKRRQAAAHYLDVLAELPLALPTEPLNMESVYHLFVVRTPSRDRLLKELGSRGIGVGLHYPIPLHLQAGYKHLNLPVGSYPNAELSASTVLSLPMHPALTIEQVDLVAVTCAEVIAEMV